MGSNKPEYIIIHTAGAATEDGRVVHQTAEVIRQYHMSKGWRDIGYHYYIEANGEVRKGRDELERGAHCIDQNMNARSIGICCSGHGDIEDFTHDQYASLLDLIHDLCARYGIEYRKVLGHRETGAKKTCPGDKVDMARLRNSLSASAGLHQSRPIRIIELDDTNVYHLRLPTGQDVKVTLEVTNG